MHIRLTEPRRETVRFRADGGATVRTHDDLWQDVVSGLVYEDARATTPVLDENGEHLKRRAAADIMPHPDL